MALGWSQGLSVSPEWREQWAGYHTARHSENYRVNHRHAHDRSAERYGCVREHARYAQQQLFEKLGCSVRLQLQGTVRDRATWPLTVTGTVFITALEQRV